MQSYVTEQELVKLGWERRLLTVEPDVLEVLLDPFGEKSKEASLRRYEESHSGGSSGWLSRFRGTPFAQKAIELLQRQIQNQSQYQQLEAQEDQLQQQQQPIFDQRRMMRRQDEALETEKEMLALELESWLLQQQQQGTAPPEDPMAEAQAMGMDPAQMQQAQAEGQAKAASDARTLLLMKKVALGPLPAAAATRAIGGAPSAWQRINAFGRAAAEHGLRPGTFDGVMQAMGNAAMPMAVMGALSGVATKNENEGYLSAALKGGLGGAALGAGGAVIGKGVDLHNKVKTLQSQTGGTYGSAASAVAGGALTREGRRAMRQDLRHYRQENRAANPQVPTAQQAPAAPSVPGAPSAPSAPSAAPPPSPSAPDLQAPSPTVSPSSSTGALTGPRVPATLKPSSQGTSYTPEGTLINDFRPHSPPVSQSPGTPPSPAPSVPTAGAVGPGSTGGAALSSATPTVRGYEGPPSIPIPLARVTGRPTTPTTPTIPVQDSPPLHVPTPQEVAAGYGPLQRPNQPVPKWVRDNLDFPPNTIGNPARILAERGERALPPSSPTDWVTQYGLPDPNDCCSCSSCCKPGCGEPGSALGNLGEE